MVVEDIKGYIFCFVYLDILISAFGSFSAIGSWHIPYTHDSYASDSQYLHCGGGIQTAVTHSGVTISMFVISLQWKPPDTYQGIVTITASIVKDYTTYWTGLESTPVHVVSHHDDDEENSDDIVYVDSDTLFGDKVEGGREVKYKSNPNLDLPKIVTMGSSRNPKEKPEDTLPDLPSFEEANYYSHYAPVSRPDISLEQLRFNFTEKPESYRIPKSKTDVNIESTTKASIDDNDKKTPSKVLDDKTIDLNTSIYVVTEAARKGRINAEDPYKKLEAHYGAWEENSAAVEKYHMAYIILCTFVIVRYFEM